MSGQLTVAIDFDGTWDRCPEMFQHVSQVIQSWGGRAICVNAREDTPENREIVRQFVPPSVPIYFTGGAQKQWCMEQQGIKVDIWIDNEPKTGREKPGIPTPTYQPEHWVVEKDTIYFAIPALEAGIEHARSQLRACEMWMGPDTPVSKSIQGSIHKMGSALQRLKSEPHRESELKETPEKLNSDQLE